MPKKADILMTGVGGQGVIMASDILTTAALASGYDVKKTDSLGMAQRGGSVTSHVRLGDKVFSPMIPPGDADFLVSYERLEAVRSSAILRPDGIAIVDSVAVTPLSVTIEGYHYPSVDEVRESLTAITQRAYILSAMEMATKLGNPRASSILLLGFLSVFLEIPEQSWLDEIKRHLPPRLHEVNLAAFSAGVEAARERRKEEGK
jgi:indolepyruvate ferredoxin oxidoreductase beta subunit